MGFTLLPKARTVIATDVKCYMLPDEFLSTHTRSSVGIRAVMITNTVGIVDSDFYSNPGHDGNIHIHLHNLGDEPFVAGAGDRIAQGIFTKYLLTDDDDFASGPERQGGYGHTGR